MQDRLLAEGTHGVDIETVREPVAEILRGVDLMQPLPTRVVDVDALVVGKVGLNLVVVVPIACAFEIGRR
jgi:hypothetical protein